MSLRRKLRNGVAGLTCLALAACASGGADDAPPVTANYQPDSSSLEGGLWHAVEKLENEVRTSGARIEDPALEAYLREIACRISIEHCQSLRIYVLAKPGLNASMAPNGFMILQSGLLLRADNEAEVGLVVGHELAHYLERHTLQVWEEIWDQTDGLVFFQIATSMVGLGLIGALATLPVAGEIYGFNREQEEEADRLGLTLLSNAGYDGREAVKLWDDLVAELNAQDEDYQHGGYFATHPEPGQRLESLRAQAAGLPPPSLEDPVGIERHHQAVAPFLADWLAIEMQIQDLGGREEMLNQLAEGPWDQSIINHYYGELYRLHGDEGDLERAKASYQLAIELGPSLPESHRQLGLIYYKQGDQASANGHFARYLELSPEASDRQMIQSYLESE